MTPRRVTLLTLAALLWVAGAWHTRGIDSDRPTSSSAGNEQGEGSAPAEGPTWTAPETPSPVAGAGPEAVRDVAKNASPTAQPRASRASRSHRPLPAILLRIRWCESRHDYQAENPRSTASGAWQILDGTWDGYGGYLRAKYAPPPIQDSKALALYRDRGTQPWNASRRCWS